MATSTRPTQGPAPPVVLDASVWISRTITTDVNYHAARAWAVHHISMRGVFVVPTLFEVEIAAAISRVTKDSQLARKEVIQLHRLNARGLMRFVPVSARVVRSARDFAINFGLRADDAIYAGLAQQLGIPLVTSDAELLNLPPTTVVTIKP